MRNMDGKYVNAFACSAFPYEQNNATVYPSHKPSIMLGPTPSRYQTSTTNHLDSAVQRQTPYHALLMNSHVSERRAGTSSIVTRQSSWFA